MLFTFTSRELVDILTRELSKIHQTELASCSLKRKSCNDSVHSTYTSSFSLSIVSLALILTSKARKLRRKRFYQCKFPTRINCNCSIEHYWLLREYNGSKLNKGAIAVYTPESIKLALKAMLRIYVNRIVCQQHI